MYVWMYVHAYVCTDGWTFLPVYYKNKVEQIKKSKNIKITLELLSSKKLKLQLQIYLKFKDTVHVASGHGLVIL